MLSLPLLEVYYTKYTYLMSEDKYKNSCLKVLNISMFIDLKGLEPVNT